MFVRETVRVGSVDITIETGRLAKQAHGAVLITLGETVVLSTAVSSTDERPGIDFFPLTCEYIEKTFAAGKIPGGFFKREGRPRDYEVLTARLTDRPLRPLFPEGYRCETQVIATVLSADKINASDVLALTGASAALHISDIPWDGPIAGVRVGRIDGEFIAFPTFEQLETSDIDIVVACSRDAVVMVEGGCKEVQETDLVEALMFAHKSAQPILDLIERLRESVGKPKRPFERKLTPEHLTRKLHELTIDETRKALGIADKQLRYNTYKAIKTQAFEKLTAEFGAELVTTWEKALKAYYEDEIKGREMREMILSQGKRIDGRDVRTIRPISCEVGLLPRTHGSALFQRGETQAIVVTTLGTSQDEQKIDNLLGDSYKSFMLHYNFPPYSTGECKRVGSPGRREIGHGHLAELALVGMIPAENFPYTIRIVAEVLESNGSSSMASVCGACLSLMDAGVQIKSPVAGIAMGLIKEGDRTAILSDILGDEDHLGDMDFKVCGTARGVTAIQMDIKIKGLSRDIMAAALDQAREGRLYILGKMLEALPGPRPEMSKWAPRITSIKVKPDQIRLVIGPGGKTIKGIVDQTGVTIDVEDDGTVNVASSDPDAVKRALDIIKGLTAEPEVNAIYKGTVKRIVDFGAFVEILPNIDGLLHISEIAHQRIERVEDVLHEGDPCEVKVLSIDREGKVRLSRKELLPPPPPGEGPPPGERPSGDRPDRGPPRDRGSRGDRGPRRGPPRDGGGGGFRPR
ncbi:MAG: polyribonucleotide nucleotidyltransferase [Deltaproteobacteria bacterium]|nr:polyribonucleotide nucleotidyltransferase [Deltaproteobacteria bacterium]